MNKVQKLEMLQNAAMAKWIAKKLPNGEYETYCNLALFEIMRGMGCPDFEYRMASEIVKDVLAGEIKGWSVCSWARAVDVARLGNVAVMGWANPDGAGHGHVASLAPKPIQKSPSWGVDVPILANVGRPPNGLRLASACFKETQRTSLHCFAKNI